MRVLIDQIRVGPGRREVQPEHIRELAGSFKEVGLLNPITVGQDYTLIAGLHRLEAAKLLGWTEIECTVSELTGLQAELAEIDENFVRVELGSMEYGDLLLRRKEIYEKLHPETKNGGDKKSEEIRTRRARSDFNKSFVTDTAEKLGVSKRTVEENIQLAKDLTPKAKEIIKNSSEKVKKKDMLRVSRLPPDRQEEAARQLAAGNAHAVDSDPSPPARYDTPDEELDPAPDFSPPPDAPYSLGGRTYATFEESVADLKNHDKDCSYTPDTLLADMDSFIERFHRDFGWYSNPMCTVVFPHISMVQFEYIKQRFSTISSAMEEFLRQMKGQVKS